MLTLYGVPPTRAIRPIWLLNELDLDCRIEALATPEENAAWLAEIRAAVANR